MAKIIGIDIGKDTLKMALIRSGKKPGLLWYFKTQIPETYFQGEHIVDFEGLTTLVFDTLKQHKIKARTICSVVSDSKSTFTPFEYDGIKKKDIYNLLQLNLNQNYPGQLDQYAIRYQLTQNKKGKIKGCSSYTKIQSVEDVRSVLTFKKYRLKAIDHPVNAIVKSLQAWAGRKISKHCVLVLDIGLSSTTVIILNQLKLIEARTIDAGSRDIDFQISGTLNCSMSEAKDIKESGLQKAAESGVKVQTFVDSTFSGLFMAIEDMINGAIDDGKINLVESIYLMGGGSKITGIESLIKDFMSIETKHLNPTDFNLPYLNDIQECLIAAGSAIRRR